MPVMNGYESTEKIRSYGVDVPIIAVTASAIKGEKEKCLACGMSDFLTKPFKKEDLVLVLNRWIKSSEKNLFPDQKSGSPVPIETAPSEESPGSHSINSDYELIPGLENLPIFNYTGALDTFLGNQDVLLSLLSPFMDKTTGQIREMKELDPITGAEEISHLAHSIKGGSRNLDMHRLGMAGEFLELAGKDEITEDILKGILFVEREFRVLEPEIRKHL